MRTDDRSEDEIPYYPQVKIDVDVEEMMRMDDDTLRETLLKLYKSFSYDGYR